MYNKTIIIFGFCDIRNNQGLGKCMLSALAFGSADNSYLDLDSKEVSFEWSLQRISPTDSKVRATLQKSFIHYAGESIKS